ncbi:hypothetical protein MMC29_002944 [Sticta canariensis]|nr:hypothetical protein [Sticta canariensis]
MIELSEGSEEDWAAKGAFGLRHTCRFQDQYLMGSKCYEYNPNSSDGENMNGKDDLDDILAEPNPSDTWDSQGPDRHFKDRIWFSKEIRY